MQGECELSEALNGDFEPRVGEACEALRLSRNGGSPKDKIHQIWAVEIFAISLTDIFHYISISPRLVRRCGRKARCEYHAVMPWSTSSVTDPRDRSHETSPESPP